MINNMKIFEFIDIIAGNRLANNNPSNVIQLSRILMDRVIDEVNHDPGEMISHVDDTGMLKIYYKKYNVKWTILCRSYRDDTNDEDVEELLYKLLFD